MKAAAGKMLHLAVNDNEPNSLWGREKIVCKAPKEEAPELAAVDSLCEFIEH